MRKPKKKTYAVQLEITLLTTVGVSASSLEEAVEKGRQYEVTDVVEFSGDHIDSSIELTGVY